MGAYEVPASGLSILCSVVRPDSSQLSFPAKIGTNVSCHSHNMKPRKVVPNPGAPMQLSAITPEILGILTNKEILAINQDPAVGKSVSPFRWGINVSGALT